MTNCLWNSYQTRINLNYIPLSRLSMDLMVMPRSYKGHKYILCIIDEVMSYLIIVPIHQSRSEEIGDALIENVISKYCVPNYIIIKQDSAFMSSYELFKKLDIKIKNSGTLQSSIIIGRTWNKIIVYNLDQTSNRFRTNVTKIFASGNFGI